jgi:uncharacterized membrane-anchored protein
MLTKQTKFVLAISLQIAIILLIVVFKLAILGSGTDILLKVSPVDPQDPLRGDYVAFQYDDISSLPFYYTRDQNIRNGDTVYVVLSQSGKYWIGESFQKSKPPAGKLFIKGKVESGGVENQPNIFSYQRSVSDQLHIVYGIEQYFIPEGQGRNFNFLNKEVAARVAVDDSGNAVLKQIYVDGKPWP